MIDIPHDFQIEQPWVPPTADEKADITVEQMTSAETWQQAQDIIKAYVAVMELSAKFFNIPEVEPKDEKPAEEAEDEEKAKN